MRQLLKDHKEEGWEAIWKMSDKPPWDNGGVQPLLRYYVESGRLGLPEGRRDVKVLVPGCGKGYDAIYFASLGYQSVGMDISPEGIRLAGDRAKAVEGVTFKCADFFKEEEKFDIVYDYTFFCALGLDKREEYAKRMKSIIKPGGLLITLVFPIKEELVDGVEQGPPFGYNPELYKDLLGDDFKCVMDEYPPIPIDNRDIKRMNLYIRS